jgi:4-alpha-glucanotransferase
LGTHDNDTSRGWFEGLKGVSAATGPEAQAAREQLARLAAYTGIVEPSQVNPQLRRALLTSPANTVFLTVQDLLDQDSRHRVNIPGTATGNWGYRVPRGALTAELAQELYALTEVSERLVK